VQSALFVVSAFFLDEPLNTTRIVAASLIITGIVMMKVNDYQSFMTLQEVGQATDLTLPINCRRFYVMCPGMVAGCPVSDADDADNPVR